MKTSIIAIIAALTVSVVSGQSTPAQMDLAEMKSGEKIIFNSSGHAKSKGLEFTIKAPKSWSMQEGDRPNVIQKFRSAHGHGVAQFLITTKTMPAQLSKDDLKELYAKESMKEIFSELGTYVQSSSLVLDGEPAGYCEYKVEKKRLDNVFFMHGCSFIVCWKTTMLQIQCMIASDGMTAEQAEMAFAQYLPVFRSIASSIVLTSKWK